MPTRRTFMLGAAGAGATLAAGPVTAQEGTDLTDWLADTDGAGSVTDRTGSDTVTVTVGADANGGAFGYGPPVVRIDPGATIRWEWTGGGGSHNVIASDGSFESSMQGEQGATFEHTFESAGVTRYYCTPHKAVGMRGAVVTGDANVSLPGSSTATPTPSANETDTGEQDAPDARSFDGWLANTDNYTGVVDKRGSEEVTVTVGAEGNGGQLAFDPPAIHVSPGTTVRWVWDGPNQYDVVDPELGYESATTSAAGYEYAVEFGGDGLSTYECEEYGDQGMRGVVVVGNGPQQSLSWQGVGVAGAVGTLLSVPLALAVRLHHKTSTRSGKSHGPKK
ncbi:halocyanin domain-containing protein [Halosegnis rubeus]|uniref:Halocyanin domain-containing protein n=1 Tax=Halosegnis rubeus TaxID=2212850 RepID=A0A5N5ULC8_9EURY|nr:halocyanin domain-containing protein [Halosegnis rubeus]KAB7519706.1 halocyanin domain-containing protein [Halosegnis rubeus]